MPQWVSVYDVRQESPPIQGEIRGGLAGVLIGALLLAVVWQRRDRAPKLFVVLFLVAWVGFTLATGVQVVRVHRDAQARLARGAVEWTEGVVENLVPPPADGGFESFRVGQKTFLVADGETKTPGLSRTSVRGGPVRKGARVRIASSGKSILAVSELRPE